MGTNVWGPILLLIVSIAVVAATYFARREPKDDSPENIQPNKDKCLDYLLRFYSLNLSDPYVTKPGYDDKRCYHCHYATGFGHDALCPWLACQPLVQKLYRDNQYPQIPTLSE